MRRNQTFDLPEPKEVRRFNCQAIGFVFTFIMACRDWYNLPTDSLTAIVNPESLLLLMKKIQKDEDTGAPIALCRDEILMLYACHDLWSQLLITGTGEKHAEMTLENVSADHFLKKFAAYRDYNLPLNKHVMYDIEKVIGLNWELRDLKKKLAEAVNDIP